MRNTWRSTRLSTRVLREACTRRATAILPLVGRSFSSASVAKVGAKGREKGEATLVLLRHGQSIWNQENRFTGWCDVPLTYQGREEAVEAGKILGSRGYRFDLAFTSDLKRAYETCELALQAMHSPTGPEPEADAKARGEAARIIAAHAAGPGFADRGGGGGGLGLGSVEVVGGVVVVKSMGLNERHYGDLQGLRKDDPELLKKYGESDVFEWRRSFGARPPPIDSCHPFWQPPPAPPTESLHDCQLRVEAYYKAHILPALLGGKKTVLVVAHANTIRALVKVVDDITAGDIRGLRIPNSIPLVYRLHPETLEPVAESDEWGFQGEYLTSWQRADTAVRAVERSQRRVLQALFRAMDTEDTGVIQAKHFQRWVMSTGQGMIKESSSNTEELRKEGARAVVAKHKSARLKSLHFFRKFGVEDPNTTIDFDRFIELSAEFWDSSNHFRMIDSPHKEKSDTKEAPTTPSPPSSGGTSPADNPAGEGPEAAGTSAAAVGLSQAGNSAAGPRVVARRQSFSVAYDLAQTRASEAVV